jgi:hypothetical protein
MDLDPATPDPAASAGGTTGGTPTRAEEERPMADIDLVDPDPVLADLPASGPGDAGDR